MAMSPRLLRPIASGVHPEAADWRARVIANGGTVSGSTLQAVSRLCTSISSAGIRDRFYRLGIFAGDNLNAALVPLYRGPTFGGTTYGNATDTNNGPFLSADFSESVGLNANGSVGNSSKYLDTGLAPDDTPTGSTVGHASVWKGAGSSGAATLSFIGSRTALAFWYMRQNASTDNLTGNWGVGAFVGSTSDTAAGLVLHTRDASGYVLYKNTSSIGTAGASTPGGNANDFVVFNHRGTDGSVASVAGWPFVISSYSIGNSLSSAEVTSYYNALTAFNTAMGR